MLGSATFQCLGGDLKCRNIWGAWGRRCNMGDSIWGAHVGAARGAHRYGAVISAPAEVAEAAPSEAVSSAVAVVQFWCGTRQEPGGTTHQLIWGAVIKKRCKHKGAKSWHALCPSAVHSGCTLSQSHSKRQLSTATSLNSVLFRHRRLIEGLPHMSTHASHLAIRLLQQRM